jgi:hypothetical protein
MHTHSPYFPVSAREAHRNEMEGAGMRFDADGHLLCCDVCRGILMPGESPKACNSCKKVLGWRLEEAS